MELALFTVSGLTMYEIGPLDVDPESRSLHPYTLSLSPPFPNPFNSTTTISYQLPFPGRYALDVVDITGRLVTRLDGGWKAAGSYRQVWDAKGVAAGTYTIQYSALDKSFIQKVVLVK